MKDKIVILDHVLSAFDLRDMWIKFPPNSNVKYFPVDAVKKLLIQKRKQHQGYTDEMQEGADLVFTDLFKEFGIVSNKDKEEEK